MQRNKIIFLNLLRKAALRLKRKRPRRAARHKYKSVYHALVLGK